VSSRAVTGPTSVLALVRQILVKAGLSAVEGLRPWLRREAWTARGLKEALSGIPAHPWKAAAFLALGGAALFSLQFFFGADGLGGMPTGLVREGPFRVTITEIGTLQPLRSVTYASTIQSNQAKIVALAPEGKMVEKKDLLILFDSTPFEEEIRRNQALLSEAEADLQKTKEDLKLQRIQNEEDIAASKQKMEQTDLELKDVQQGKGRLKEEEADNAVNDAQRELQKALAAASDLKPLLAEGFITKLELERAEQQVQKARGELALAEQRREALVNFSRPLELSQARSDALLTKESVRQLQAAADYRLEQKKAAIVAAQSRSQEAASKLAQARQQLARTEVRADVPGIVVYRDVFFGSEQRKPQVGDQVWANQPLLILPDISKMVVETKIRETDIHKVERNQRVVIRTEAYPDLKLSGAVTLVGTLAQEEKDRRGTRFLGVTIQVNESETRLRPGMTARVEIEVETRPRALFVPLEAVFERDGRSLCYVVEHRRIVPREVVLGPSNQNFVVIEDGLRKGARVCLRDPAAPASDFGSAATP
jgi:HlyD family secretion protein